MRYHQRMRGFYDARAHRVFATAIEAREKPAPKPKAAKPKRRKRGRPRKGEEQAKEPSRLERQLTMSLPHVWDAHHDWCWGIQSRKAAMTQLLLLRLWSLLIWFDLHHTVGVTIIFFTRVVSVI